MNARRIAAALALLLTLPFPAAAWGPTGHRVVGRIAERHLTLEAARAVADLIGPLSLAQVSTWPDDIRSDPNWKKAEPWHFLSIDDHETLATTARSDKGDILEAMERFEKTLRDPQADRQAKAEALKFLVHFVGDVHQPLHVGRREDLGGNNILVLWFREPSNLHSVWDGGLIDSTKLSFSELAEFIDHPTSQEIADWQRATYADWIQESFGFRAKVYEIGRRDLGYEYSFQQMPLVERRLLQAGVRLAGLLNSIFPAEAPQPGV